MKNTTDTRYPRRKIKVNRPDHPEVKRIIDRERNVIAENIAAYNDAKIILLIPPGRILNL